MTQQLAQLRAALSDRIDRYCWPDQCGMWAVYVHQPLTEDVLRELLWIDGFTPAPDDVLFLRLWRLFLAPL
jgi:hypothetical protein